MTKKGKSMAHAIIRGANGRRHEVDLEDTEITLEIFFGEEAVEIAIESAPDSAPSGMWRFALLNVSRQLFNQALGEAARRSKHQTAAAREA
jgi:hypothetical protein